MTRVCKCYCGVLFLQKTSNSVYTFLNHSTSLIVLPLVEIMELAYMEDILFGFIFNPE